ncbi:MAG: tRNA glutamyl-Q(34) synthetase GluQRS [Sphingomonadaceae bacterium]
MRSPFITRFAPSPTGRLHLGHAFSAIVAAELARRTGGRWLLRIEDIDASRCRPELEEAIHADLAWLGLTPDGVMVQSARMPAYKTALDDLREKGLLYPCFCTRADIARAAAAPHAGETLPYPGTCRGRPIDETELAARPHGWRLDLAATGLAVEQQWLDVAQDMQQGRADAAGDPVLARKDAPVSYHLACVLDDAAQGVTVVTRGADLIDATPLQRLLQTLLGLPAPAYAHHPLLTDANGRRLAKRDDAASVAAMREAGMDARALHMRLLAQAEEFLLAVTDVKPDTDRMTGARPPSLPGGSRK